MISKQQGTYEQDVIDAAYRVSALRNEAPSKTASGRRSAAILYLCEAVERHESAKQCEVNNAN